MVSSLLLPLLLSTTLTLAAPSLPHRRPSAFHLAVHSSSSPPLPSLSSNFHGLFGSQATAESVYILPSDVLLSSSSLLNDPSWTHVELNQQEEMVLVWIGQAGIATPESNSFAVGGEDLVKKGLETIYERIPRVEDHFMVQGSDAQEQQQATFGGSLRITNPLAVVHSSPNSAIISIHSSYLPYIDLLLPSGLVPVVIPAEALPRASGVPQERVDFLAKLTKNLKFSPKVEKLVNTLSIKDFTADLRWLTGEDESSPILSRHSFSSSAVVAARWIKKTVEAQTPGVKCTLAPFLPGFTPNVLCEYPQILSNATEGASKGELERNVIVSAHYDSRGSFGSTRAPGADDDGSGTVQLLGIARALGRAGVKGFKEKVTIAFFAGEEQGLLGSRSFAKELYEANATVLIQVQADMLAYHDPAEPLQLGFPDLIGTPEAAFLLGNLSQIYSPALVVGKTGACCSDHQSFNSYGFAATQVFERNGGIIDPMYHNSGDLSDRPGFDFEQLREIAKVTFATLLEVGLPVF